MNNLFMHPEKITCTLIFVEQLICQHLPLTINKNIFSIDLMIFHFVIIHAIQHCGTTPLINFIYSFYTTLIYKQLKTKEKSITFQYKTY